MKILFVKPPSNPHVLSMTRYEPLEFEYLAASVPGHDTDIFDMRIEGNLIKKIESFHPDVAGITACSCDVKMVKRIVREIKNCDGRIKTVVGGNHATFLPGDFRDAAVDTVFLGYADHTFPKYIKALQEGSEVREIENLGIVTEGSLFLTEKRPVDPDLNGLPLPARHLTAKYRHRYHDSLRNRIALVMSSRGCPFRCTFCACWKLTGGRYRTRNVESLIRELKSLPDDIPMVYFADDNTVHDIPRAWELAREIKEHRIQKRLQMYARVDTITRNPDLFRSLREAGLAYLTVGFESIKDETLKGLNKRTTVQMNDEAIAILKKLGIYINAHFLVHPAFDRRDFSDLLRYVDDRQLFRPAYPVLTPLPGTALYEQTRKDFVITDYDYFDFTHSVLPTRLERKQFYFQLARLYDKSYSVKRHLKYLLLRKDGRWPGRPDGISLLKMMLIRTLAVVPYLRMRNAYRSELPVRSARAA